ncbi:peptidylprolyl isomerase [Geothermobacter ehrlichii]|nr:peptidyl-prolyl cis-trans isomerase [Geothermobacter ehrlichii]
MRGLRCLVLVLLLVAGLVGCRRETPESRPLLRVNDRVLSAERFDREFARSLPADRLLSPDERRDLRRSFLAQIIDRELILAEADRLDLQVTAGELTRARREIERDYADREFEQMLERRGLTLDEWQRQLTDELLIEKVIDLQVRSRIAISDQEVAAYYRDHRDEFDRPEQARARQIVVGSREEGERLLGLLRQGESFAEVARAHSLSPDAEQGGDLGWFPRGQMPPEFDRAVFSLPVGRLSDLVKSPYGYHIFLVEERRPARRLALDEARDEIRKILRRQAEKTAFQSWLKELRRRARIEIDLQQLDRTASG